MTDAIAPVVAVLFVLAVVRVNVVHFAIAKEIDLVSVRVRRGIESDAITEDAEVAQGYAKVDGALKGFVLCVLDLRKWTHRQFFPHGSAT